MMQNDTLVESAAAFARQAHRGQVRRYTGAAYFTHPEAVARLVAMRTDRSELIAAAYLHDTMEDCGVCYGELESRFGAAVAGIVAALTNDEERKAACGKVAYMTEKLSGLSSDALLVKLCDTLHNITETPDERQARTYKLIVEGGLALHPAGWNAAHDELARGILDTFRKKWGPGTESAPATPVR